MKCPYCRDDESEDFLGLEELGLHIAKEHPEKIVSPENIAKALEAVASQRQLYELAATLAGVSIGAQGAPQEATLTCFRFFIKELFALYRKEKEERKPK